MRLLSSGALNDIIPMTYVPRPGTALLINGNNVILRDLQAGAGTGTYQNGAATPATLTTYLTANRALSVGTPLQNGGTGALNIVASAGAFTLTFTTRTARQPASFELRTGILSLTGTAGTINDFTSVLVSGASTLRMTNASGSANTNRVGTVPITLIAARLISTTTRALRVFPKRSAHSPSARVRTSSPWTRRRRGQTLGADHRSRSRRAIPARS